MPTQHQRLVATAPGKIALINDTPPPPPAPGQVCLRIERTLISAGTELAKIRGLTGARKSQDWSSDPLPLGYSAAGTVLAVGSHDDPFKPGDRVSASAPHAVAATIRCSQAALLPGAVSFEEGAFGTLAALAMHIVRLSEVELGDTCAVVGFGLVGQLIALSARIAGARRVAVKEHRPMRRELASSLGFDLAEGPNEFDVVFESAGSTSSLSDALALAVKCGRVVVAGSLREEVRLNVYRDIHAKSVTLIGAHGSSQHAYSRINRRDERDNRALALDYIADGRMPVQKLITDSVPAANTIQAFDLIGERTANAVILDWSGDQAF